MLVVALSGSAAANPGRGNGHETHDEHHGPDEPTLNRFATTVAGAEFTGMFLSEDGQLFFNVQHPSTAEGDSVAEGYLPGAVGAVTGVDMNDLPADFSSVQPPKGPATRVKTAAGDYQVLAEGGDETVNGKKLGVPYNADGEPMTTGANPDFNGFVPTDDESNEGYLFTNWETQPGMVSRIHISQSRNQGKWTVHEKRNLDFRPVEGTWNNCFGTVSPWGTPLTSEEYEPDAYTWFHPKKTGYGNPEESFEEYLGYSGNPYRYGYIVEIEDPTADEPTPVKRYSMGRFSHENSVVMPDQQTVYMSDDGTGTVFFKFVADEPGDLSSGTLYAARARQERGYNPADVGFSLDWIELAHTTDKQVEQWIAEYDDQDPSTDPDYVTDDEIQRWANGNAADDRAAFLESRAAAAAVGATDEFRKMEGVNIKRDAQPGDFLYMAMSEVNETMADQEGDLQLKGNNYGAIYRMRLDGRYNVHKMEPVVTGGPNANVCGGCPYDAAPNSKSTVCQDCEFNPTKQDENGIVGAGMQKMKGTFSRQEIDPENTIANPDNLLVMRDGRVIIGEDSDLHRPNMMWILNPGQQ
ncbi:alkaline phosphatase PhoX [Natrinema sp. 74]|uniref:PhoX family protein n=1 Tax=Natrinema sp. 74 TaxID=3384159 RepID=UPI0038D3F151